MTQIADLIGRFQDNVSAGANAAAASVERLAKATERATEALERDDQVIKRAGASYDSVVRRIDGAAAAKAREEAATRKFEAAQEAVNRQLERQTITAKQAADQIARLAAVRDQDIAKANAAGAAIEGRFTASSAAIVRTSGASQMALRNLGIQSIDVFQQLASGAPIMMTMVQQGGQVAQMAAVTGTSLTSLARSAASVLAGYLPLIGVLAGAAGVAAGLFLVTNRSVELDAQQRALSVSIAGVGRAAELSADGLGKYVTQLKQQGVAAEEAVKAVSSLARNSSLSSGAIGRIVGLGPDAAAALGVGVPEAMKQLADAAKGSVEAINKLDEAFNLLTPAQGASVRAMIEHGDKAGALETVFGKLEERVRGLDRDALSPMQRATRDLGNSWDGFIDAIARSETVIAAVERLGAAVRGLASFITPYSQTPAQQLATIDERLAAVSGEIPGTNASAARLRREQAEARAALLAQRSALAQQIADAAEAGGGIPPAYSNPSLVSPTAGRELAASAASRVSGSDAGRLTALRTETEKFREALAALDPAVSGNRALIDTYTQAIKANEKSIEDMNKKNEEHRTGLQKTADTYEVQIKAQKELTAAYGESRDAVQRVLAVQEAEQKVISEGLVKGKTQYAAAVASVTDQIIRLRAEQGGAKAAEALRDIEDETKAQQRIMEAYDGTELSIIRATNAEKAHTTAIRAGLTPSMENYEKVVKGLASAYDTATDMAREFQLRTSSVNELFGAFGQAVDRIGQGLVDMFLSGGRAAVNFGQIARAAIASVASTLFRMSIVNPITNALGGTPQPTFGAALAGLSGGQSSGGLLSGVSNALSLGKLSDALGLSNFGGQLSSFGEAIGLTGNSGLFSSIGSGVQSLLGTQVLTGPAGSLASVGGAEFGGAALAEAGAPISFGSLAAGAGLGFGVGSLAGGFLQSSLGKTGPAPTIGAGIGGIGGAALAGSVFGPVGTIIGGLIGGLLGGGGGAFIGPGKANPFSATGITTDASGQVGVGQTFAQIVDTQQEVQQLGQSVAQLNAVLAAAGAKLANAFSVDEYGQNRVIGADSGKWLNFGQGDGRPGTLGQAFSELRFSSSDPYAQKALGDRSFASFEEFQAAAAEVKTFVDQVAPALKTLTLTEPSYGAGQLSTTIEALRAQFDAAVITADKLGWAEYNLTEARDKAIQIANDNANKQIADIDNSLTFRRLAAEGIWENNPQKQAVAVLGGFDKETETQLKAFREQMLTLYGDWFKDTAEFETQMDMLQETRRVERLAAQKSYLDAMNRQMEQATNGAANAVSGITNYVQGLALSSESPLSGADKYEFARGQFNSSITAAHQNDPTALAGLTGYAESLRSAARAQYGSGEQYQTTVQQIIAQLQGVVGRGSEALTATIYTAETRRATETLATIQAEGNTLLLKILDELRRAAVPAARAA